MRAYSLDLRERVLADYDLSMSNEAIARKFSVSTRWIFNLRKLRERTGDIVVQRAKPGPKPKLAKYTDQLVKLLEEKPDATLDELRDQLGVLVSIGTVHNAIKRLGYTLKKSGIRC